MAKFQAILNLLFKKDVRNQQGANLVVQNYVFSTVFVPKHTSLGTEVRVVFPQLSYWCTPRKSRDSYCHCNSLAGDGLKEYWDVQNLRLWCRLPWQAVCQRSTQPVSEGEGGCLEVGVGVTLSCL